MREKGGRFEQGGSGSGKKKAKHQSAELLSPKGSDTKNGERLFFEKVRRIRG